LDVDTTHARRNIDAMRNSNPRLNITVTVPQLAWITREAKRLGVTVGELLRRIIDEVRGAK
jgi:hypothetical protein